MESSKITVLGVGNILMQDEGFGVRVVEEMQRRYLFPAKVQVLDGGTLGMELLPFISATECLLIIDAISGEKPPGSCYEFANEAVKAYFRGKVSMHELGIQDVLAALTVIEKPVQEIVVLGAEPASLEVGLELTPVVAACIEPVIKQALFYLQKWQAEVVAR